VDLEAALGSANKAARLLRGHTRLQAYPPPLLRGARTLRRTSLGQEPPPLTLPAGGGHGPQGPGRAPSLLLPAAPQGCGQSSRPEDTEAEAMPAAGVRVLPRIPAPLPGSCRHRGASPSPRHSAAPADPSAAPALPAELLLQGHVERDRL